MIIDKRRIFRAKPAKAQEHVGVAFVAILFGVVVGLMVAELAGEVRAWVDPASAWRGSRASHLLVGVFLTVLSFLGYFASQNRPQHRINFFNYPLALFVLDVFMVFDYYLVLGFTESPIDAKPFTQPDARPEAILVTAAFLLYFLWDIVSWKISGDAQYQETIGGTVNARYGARRWVTVFFLILSSIIAGATWCLNPSSETAVVVFNVFLIVILITYRIAKPLFDSTVSIRDCE